MTVSSQCSIILLITMFHDQGEKEREDRERGMRERERETGERKETVSDREGDVVTVTDGQSSKHSKNAINSLSW